MKINKTIVAAFAAITLAGGTAATAVAAGNAAVPQAPSVTQTTSETSNAATDNSERPGKNERGERAGKNERGERAGKRGGMKGHKGHHKIAEVLGVTPEELKEARNADKSIAELAAEKGISTDDLVNKLKATAKERLDKAVADGKITQEQADTRLAKITEKAEKRLTMKPSERPNKGERPGKGERGGKWGMKGDRGQAGPTSQNA